MYSWLVRRAVRRALKRPTPRRYSIERPKNDFQHVILSAVDETSRKAIVTGINKDGLTAIFWNGNGFEDDRRILNEELKGMKFSLERVYRQFNTTYNSPLEYLILDGFGYSRFLPFFNWLGQTRFNIQFRQRRERIELLSELVELELSRRKTDILRLPHEGISATALFSLIYGERVWGRSDYNGLFERFEFILDSFVDSGELSSVGHGYRVLPRALETIDRYAVEDSRHKDSLKQNQRLTMLTVVLAAAAVFQVIAELR